MVVHRTFQGVQKTTNQIDYVTRPVMNTSPPIYTTWYPTARPLKHYRKQGQTSSHTTNASYTSPPNCNPCAHSIRVGKPFKMLGKRDDGMLKEPCCQPGNVMSFSGKAMIKSANTIVNPKYHSNYHAYLKSRGNTYVTKSTFHKIPNVDYTKVPDNTPLDSSHYIENLPTVPKCNITIYKPSNDSFSTDGGVDGSTYTARQKYLAITKNNSSFIKPWGIRMSYNENPLFFSKNTFYKCKKSWNPNTSIESAI